LQRFKLPFTIKNIGEFRFFSGLIIGILYSLILNQLFRLTTKLCNVGTFWDIDNWIINQNYELENYSLILINFASISFALCFTTYIWLSKPIIKNNWRKRHSRFGQTNSIFMFYFTLIFLTKLLSFWVGTDLSLKNDFGLLSFLLPRFMSFYCWILIRRVYKMNIIFYITILILIMTSMILNSII
jgi:hypothetical protein